MSKIVYVVYNTNNPIINALIEYKKRGHNTQSTSNRITLLESYYISLAILRRYRVFKLTNKRISDLIMFTYFSYMLIFTKDKKYLKSLQNIGSKLSKKHKKLMDLIIELYDKIEITNLSYVSKYCYAKELSIPRAMTKDWRSFLDEELKDMESSLKDGRSFLLLDALFISFETLKYNLLKLIRKKYDKKIKDLLFEFKKLMDELQDNYNRILIQDFIINYYINYKKESLKSINITLENVYDYLNNLPSDSNIPDICLFILKYIKNRKPVKIKF